MPRQLRITFEPHGRAVVVLPGATLLEASSQAGLVIDTPCGGAGTCGKCRVQMVAGVAEPTEADRDIFGEDELSEGWRLACQALICKEAVVRVPESSLFASHHQILASAETATPQDTRPAVCKAYVELQAPTREDDTPDLLRLEQQVGACTVNLALLRQLPARLRNQDFSGTAVIFDDQLIDFEQGDTTAQCYGVAFDVGTTTLVGSLLDLRTGDELAVTCQTNPQVRFGDDVLSRISHCGSCRGGLGDLHRAVVTEIAGMIERVCAEATIHRRHVYEIVFAGNTTMEHLLCAIDPTQLGQVPFVPAHARGLLFPARDLAIPINDQGVAYVFPVIGGFVGGDTVAGMLATQLVEADKPALMIDIGTNGEIVLAHDGQIWAASTAAGPAFEGARISCGMRATRGAIEKVVLDKDIQVSVIGNSPAIGLCGSGLIDLVAELLKHGIVSLSGRLLPPQELPPSLPDALARRVQYDPNGGVQFLVVEHSAAGTDSPVVLTQKDIRELQLASGAIRAGLTILLKRAGVQPHELGQVLIAGGFGSFIRRNNARRIGLLPAGIKSQQIHYVGNVSLGGAKWALLSTQARNRAEELAQRARHVELSTDVGFQTEFAEAMIFPADVDT